MRSNRSVKAFLVSSLKGTCKVKNGLASARYPFLKVVREYLRGKEELCNVAAFSAGPSPHEDCLAEETFVDDGAWRSTQNKQDVWEPVLRKDMDAEGAKAVSLCWVDRDKGDADRPSYRSRLVVREINKAMKQSDVPFAAELFSGIPPLEECESIPLSVRLPQSGIGKGRANSCDARHEACTFPWSTSETSVCGTL